MPIDVLVLGDLMASRVNIEGQLYVMGDATMSATAIGHKLPNSYGERNDLVVGGALSFSSGHVSHGNIYHGPNSLVGNSVVEGMPGGSAVYEAEVTNFESLNACYQEQTDHYCALTPTGFHYMNDSTLTLQSPNDDEVFASFEVSCEDITRARVLVFNTPTAHQTVLINVVGDNEECELDVNVQYASEKVLFNFCRGITGLQMRGPTEGAVLASHLKVTGDDGDHNGQLVAGEFDGAMSFEHTIFNGCLPAFRQ